MGIYGIYTLKNIQSGLKLNYLYIVEVMDEPVNNDIRKKLKYLREQRCRVKKRLNELRQTTGNTNTDEELRLFNYWKGQCEAHKAAFEEYKQKEVFFKGRFDNAETKLKAAMDGCSKPIRVQEIRLEAFDEEIDECEATLEGRKSKGLIRAEAMVEDIITKQLIEQAKLIPKTISTTSGVKKQPKQCKSAPKIEQPPAE